MIIELNHQNKTYQANLAQPIDISIPIGQTRCFYAPELSMTPYTNGEFVGAVKAGSPVNFFDVKFNPHGNGTHTECLGHITAEQQSINQQLKQFHFIAQLITLNPSAEGNDKFIKTEQLKEKVFDSTKALIIRTLPNDESKLRFDYSGTNPTYIDAEAMKWLVDNGVKHLLIDLPSVDREDDGGAVQAHKIFWGLVGHSEDDRSNCSITELIFISDDIPDGLYLLNLQIAPFDLDASPSKPIIYSLTS